MLTFDLDGWGTTPVDNDEIDDLDGYHTDDLLCGHWVVGVAHLRDFRQWEYLTRIASPEPPDDASALYQDVLVRDFPSLLRLFTLLRSADIELAPKRETSGGED